jgi:transposase
MATPYIVRHAGSVIEELVPDELWQRVAPLLPARPPRRSRYPGRLPADDRAALAGIVFVLKTGITWRELPHEVAGCSGVTCWRRLRDWTEAGVFPAVHTLLLDQLRALGQLDLDTMVVDGWRHPAGRHAHRRQSSRQHPTDPADPHCPEDPRYAGQAPSATSLPLR